MKIVSIEWHTSGVCCEPGAAWPTFPGPHRLSTESQSGRHPDFKLKPNSLIFIGIAQEMSYFEAKNIYFMLLSASFADSLP